MMILLVIGLISGVCGGYLKSYHPVTVHLPVQNLLEKGNIDEVYDTFYTMSNGEEHNNDELKVMSHIREVYSNNLRAPVIYYKPEKVEEISYLLVKTLRHRNKRYVSYFPLCHFKICNMGRKRTTTNSRFLHMISRTDEKHKH